MESTADCVFEHYTYQSLPARLIAERVEHHNRMLREELPDDPPFPVADALKRMARRPSSARVHVWVLRRGRQVVAEAALRWAERETNRRSAGIAVSVEPHLRRRGIGTRLMALAVARSRTALRPRLLTYSSGRLPAGAVFLRRLGFKPALAVHLNQLVIERLDRAVLTRWLAVGPGSADYAIDLWDGPVPDEMLEPFAALQGVMNGAPRGELQIEDTVVTPRMIREGEAFLFANGTRRLIAAARHVSSGALVGFTELAWSPSRPGIVWQYDTGVVEAHRNRGLGRRLKAANMEAMLGANAAARFVRTGNADSNAPMLAINLRMGFEPFIAETNWQGSAPTIAARLAAS